MNTPTARNVSVRRHLTGFTVVELLIVIVVIGILAAITIVAYNNIQDRSRATALATGFQKIDKAFRMMAIDQNRTTWWTDGSSSLTGVTGGSNPLIDDIIAYTTLKNYLQRSPEVSGLTGSIWWYDNDGDAYNPNECLASTSGVNIVFSDVSQKIATEVDKTIDDGNILCGKVRYNTSNGDRLLYALSNIQKVE